MTVFIKDKDHAKAVWTALKEGKLDGDPERKQSAVLAVRSFVTKLKRAREAPQERHEDVQIDNAAMRGVKAFGAGVLGAVDLGVTLLSAAAAEPFSGWAGIVSLVKGEGLGGAVHSVDQVRDFLAIGPQSAGGQEAMKSIAGPMMKLDNAMRDISNTMAFGNEIAATSIYTALLGGSTLLGVRRLTTGALNVTKKMKEMEKIADRLGLDVTQEGLKESIINAAARMSPTEAATNAIPLRNALLKAHARKESALENLRASAATDTAFLRAGDVKAFAGGMMANLRRQGFDLDDMPVLQKNMRALNNIGKKDPAHVKRRVEEVDVIALEDIQTVRNRIEQVLESRGKVTNNTSRIFRENKALTQTMRGIDDFLENSLHKDLIAGDVRSLRRWKEFYKARSEFNTNFNVDKTLKGLMDMDATPATLNQWLLGASAVGAKKQASATMGRIEKLLGKNHPAVEGIRQEFLYMVAEPLIQEFPNLPQFLRNYDKIVRKNGDLVRSMGLKTSDLEPLRNAARLAVELPAPNIIKKMLGTWETAFSRYFVGHSIAKAGVKVSLGRTALTLMFGRDTVKQKALMAALAEAQFGGSVINRYGGAAARILKAALIADLEGINEKVIRDEGRRNEAVGQ